MNGREAIAALMAAGVSEGVASACAMDAVDMGRGIGFTELADGSAIGVASDRGGVLTLLTGYTRQALSAMQSEAYTWLHGDGCKARAMWDDRKAWAATIGAQWREHHAAGYWHANDLLGHAAVCEAAREAGDKWIAGRTQNGPGNTEDIRSRQPAPEVQPAAGMAGNQNRLSARYTIRFGDLGGDTAVPDLAIEAAGADPLAEQVLRFARDRLPGRDVAVTVEDMSRGRVFAGMKVAGHFTITPAGQSAEAPGVLEDQPGRKTGKASASTRKPARRRTGQEVPARARRRSP